MRPALLVSMTVLLAGCTGTDGTSETTTSSPESVTSSAAVLTSPLPPSSGTPTPTEESEQLAYYRSTTTLLGWVERVLDEEGRDCTSRTLEDNGPFGDIPTRGCLYGDPGKPMSVTVLKYLDGYDELSDPDLLQTFFVTVSLFMDSLAEVQANRSDDLHPTRLVVGSGWVVMVSSDRSVADLLATELLALGVAETGDQVTGMLSDLRPPRFRVR